jgi:hypothetical protein
MKINDLSYLEEITATPSITGGRSRQTTVVNIRQNAYAAVDSGNGNSIGNIAAAINIAIVNIRNIIAKSSIIPQ